MRLLLQTYPGFAPVAGLEDAARARVERGGVRAVDGDADDLALARQARGGEAPASAPVDRLEDPVARESSQ